MERLVQFSLFGQSYKVYTSTSEKDMRKILALIQGASDEIGVDGAGTLASSKAAVMVSLNVASRYIQLQEEFDRYRVDMEERISSLNDQIDTSLFSENSSR